MQGARGWEKRVGSGSQFLRLERWPILILLHTCDLRPSSVQDGPPQQQQQLAFAWLGRLLQRSAAAAPGPTEAALSVQMRLMAASEEALGGGGGGRGETVGKSMPEVMQVRAAADDDGDIDGMPLLPFHLAGCDHEFMRALLPCFPAPPRCHPPPRWCALLAAASPWLRCMRACCGA